MPKIDCSITENFLKEVARATNKCNMFCYECIFRNLCNQDNCNDSMLSDPVKAIAIIQEWSDAHPIKTRLDDLKEKFPNAQLETIACVTPPAHFGFCKECGDCVLEDNTIRRCWDEPVKGGTTGA